MSIDRNAPPDDNARLRRKLYRLLGKLPPHNSTAVRPTAARPIAARVLSREDTSELIVEKLELDLNGLQPVPAYFTRPNVPESGRLPTVLFNHSHFGQYTVGKEEFVRGRDEMQQPPYALALARAGYAGLCIDSWCFGERHGRPELDLFKEMLWKGQVLWGRMVYDHLRALDYLETRPDVDSRRLATLGMSMGSTMAWWLAALDERIRVCVDLCCLTDYETLLKEAGLDRHGIYYYVPDLLNHFTTAGINALIAPRPHLSLAGRFDPLTPVEGLKKVDDALRRVYRNAGAPDAWQLRIYEVGHRESADMRRDVLSFLRQWL